MKKKGKKWIWIILPFLFSWALPMRPSERYPLMDVFISQFSWTETSRQEEWGDEEGEEERQSMLKLLFMATEELVEEEEGEDLEHREEEEEISSWTPNSLNPPTTLLLVLLIQPLTVVHVLELWPVIPHCEHFLPIFTQIDQTKICRELNFAS